MIEGFRQSPQTMQDLYLAIVRGRPASRRIQLSRTDKQTLCIFRRLRSHLVALRISSGFDAFEEKKGWYI